VCLSLLGTWHASHQSEKWHPDSANLWRILVSIQGMILIADPYFNEPVCLALVVLLQLNKTLCFPVMELGRWVADRLGVCGFMWEMGDSLSVLVFVP
jgi:hypothetical protein